MSVKKELKKMRDEIDKLISEYLEKITKIIIKALKTYPVDWDKYYIEIENIFYNFLMKVYNVVNRYLKTWYKDLPDFDVKDIFDLAYDIDGKKITERLKEYWTEGSLRLEQSKNGAINIQNYLINMYDRILFTESRVVESKLKKIKKPNNATLLIIESGCEFCRGGEYPPDEDIQLPPFHPYCNCTYYYEITDDEDDIHDLDLETEE